MQTIGIAYDDRQIRCGRIQNTEKTDFVKLKQFATDNKGVENLRAWLNECSENNHADVKIGLLVNDSIGAVLASVLHREGYRIAPLTGASIFFKYLELEKRRKPEEICALLAIGDTQTWRPMTKACLDLRSALFEREAARVKLQQNRSHNTKFATQAFDFMVQLTANAVNAIAADIAKADSRLASLMETNPDFMRDYRHVMTIPNMTELAAQALVFFYNAYPSSDSRHFVSSLGLDNARRLSIFDYRNHDMRVVRAPVYPIAELALQDIPSIKNLGERLEKQGKSNRTIVMAAMHKLVRIAWSMMKNNTNYKAE